MSFYIVILILWIMDYFQGYFGAVGCLLEFNSHVSWVCCTTIPVLSQHSSTVVVEHSKSVHMNLLVLQEYCMVCTLLSCSVAIVCTKHGSCCQVHVVNYLKLGITHTCYILMPCFLFYITVKLLVILLCIILVKQKLKIQFIDMFLIYC